MHQTLRSLADNDLLEIQKNTTNKTFVHANDNKTINSLFNDLYSINTIQPTHLTQVQILLSIKIMHLTYQFNTKTKFDDLEHNVKEAYLTAHTENYTIRTHLNLNFYHIITHITRNPLFKTFMVESPQPRTKERGL